MLVFFKKKLQEKYWTKGSTWEFDWYIDLFFAEVMAYGKNPVKIGYMQAIIGDQFMEFKYLDSILKEFDGFFDDAEKVKELIKSQLAILKTADKQINSFKENAFSPSEYEQTQKDLSLLMASVSVVFDRIISSYVKTASELEGINEEELVGHIVRNSGKTLLNKNNDKLLKMYSAHKKMFEEAKFKFESLPSEIKNKLSKHAEEFAPINTGERGGMPWSFNDYLTQMKNLANKQAYDVKDLNIKGFSDKSKDFIKYAIQINTNDNLAADKQVELDFLFQKYLRQNLGENYKEGIIENLSYQEILEVFNHPQAINKYKNRENNYKRIVWQETGQIRTAYFDSEKEFRGILKLVETEDVESVSLVIKGTVAQRGIAEGKVRLIKNKNDLNSFQKGDILVAEKTQPQYVMAMARANAIITDVGGVTSHAAIIAREFGLPCIVGTKNGTKLLKNGDIVLVDANNGTVTKIHNLD